MKKSKQYLRYAVKERAPGIGVRLLAKFELAYDRDLFLAALLKAQPTVGVVKCLIARPK